MNKKITKVEDWIRISESAEKFGFNDLAKKYNKQAKEYNELYELNIDFTKHKSKINSDIKDSLKTKENSDKLNPWSYVKRDMYTDASKENPFPYCEKPNNKKNFYISSYVCPHCNLAMFKTVFKPGQECPIIIDKELPHNKHNLYHMKRVFTCQNCKYFVTSASSLLSDGQVYELQLDTEKDYNRILNILNDYGTTKGRMN